MRLISFPLRSGWTWWCGFGLLIALPALALAVLGLRAGRAERIEREQQLHEQQKQIARLADAAITNSFVALEGELRRLEISAPDLTPESERAIADLPLFSFDRQGQLIFQRERVYFGEIHAHAIASARLIAWPPVTTQLIEQAQAAETQGHKREAADIYRRLIKTEPKLRAWSAFGLARLENQSGIASAFTSLANLSVSNTQSLTPTGLPVAFLVCSYVERLPHAEQARFIPLLERTLANLRHGQWWLSYDERRFYDAELRRLLTSVDSSKHFSEDQRLAELASLERIVHGLLPMQRDAIARSFERDNQNAFLILCLPSSRQPETWLGLAISQRRLKELLDGVVSPLLLSQSFGAVIRDAQGEAIWSKLPNDTRISQTESLRAVRGWEMAFSGASVARWFDQRQALWYGFILLLIIMLLVGLAMTARVMRREAELNRLHHEFIAAVSHEFKSPLAGIRLLMERITSGRLRTPEAANEYYAAINRETSRLERLVNRVLESQKIQAGHKQYNFVPTSIRSIAEIACQQMQTQAEAKGISLEIGTKDEIPEMLLDEVAILDALENLLDNAIKYSPSGTHVKVLIHVVGHQVQLDVCDQGIGIEADDLPRIFEKFYRAKRSEQQNGTGLGLALVKADLEAHGGTIEVTSTPGQGSRFSLRLPLLKGRQTDGAHIDR